MNGHCLVKSTVRIGENAEQVKSAFLEEYSAFKEPQYNVRVEPFIYEDEEDSIWLSLIMCAQRG